MASTQHLLRACEEGDLVLVQGILDKGIDVNSADDNGTTALQVAAGNGQEALVRLLLMRGAALDKPNSLGWTPMMQAARNGHQNVVGLLAQSNADIDARNNLGASAITLAARGGHLQICKFLVEMGIDLTPSTGIGESACEVTPLMAAALHGHDNIVRYLLDRGFDVNYRTPSMGINALMLAALNGHMATAQILIERGADPNLTNANDHTPLEVASLRGKREVRSYLDLKTTNKRKTEAEDVKPDIIEAAKAGDVQRMREILEEDVTQRDAVSPQDGATPLMFAAMMGRLDIVQLLVERGCDINKQDVISGWTALMQATYHGKKNVARYLVNAGADVLTAAKNGCTAFDMASLIDDVDTDLYRLLASRTMQVSRPDKGKKSWTLGRTTGLPYMGEQNLEDQPRSALKVWWSRMSNRFRNLKLTNTFKLPSNRLGPMRADPNNRAATLDRSPRRARSPRSPRASSSTLQKTSEMRMSVSHDPLPEGTATTTTEPMVDHLSTSVSIKSYETMMLETRKSVSMYNLPGVAPKYPTDIITTSTLKPEPVFSPPPTFETDRPKMPPLNRRKSTTSLDTPSHSVVQPLKFLQSYASNQNLHLSSTSITASNFKYSDRSPNSSGGASGTSKGKSSATSSTLTGRVSFPYSDRSPSSSGGASKGNSSATSSTLTAISDPQAKGKRVKSARRLSDSLFSEASTGPSPSPNMYEDDIFWSVTFSRHRTNRVSPNQSSSDGSSFSSLTSRHHGNTPVGGSSRGATSSTLTPTLTTRHTKSPGVTSASSDSQSAVTVIRNDKEELELGGLLKKLSLERYQPIFEEQEVDMEAFLTLSDGDLEELGISQAEPRQQILVAINELNSGKGRERQHYHDTVSTFRPGQMPPNNRYSSDSSSITLSKWDLAEDGQQLGNSNKSRSS